MSDQIAWASWPLSTDDDYIQRHFEIFDDETSARLNASRREKQTGVEWQFGCRVAAGVSAREALALMGRTIH
jgi:hypothetical protein